MQLKLGVITGSGTYSLPGEWNSRVDRNRFGEALMNVGQIGEVKVCHLPRHKSGHDVLSHMINHRANILALNEWGADAIVGTSVVEAVKSDIELGTLLVFDDMFFPDNRLPEGEPCTIFTAPSDPERGHYIADQHFSPNLREHLRKVCTEEGLDFAGRGKYACMTGPRFNSATEIDWLQSLDIAAVSQTAAPEAVLSGELEIPYALLGFPVGYANGVTDQRTDREKQKQLIGESREVFTEVFEALAENLGEIEEIPFDCGYVRRLEERREQSK